MKYKDNYKNGVLISLSEDPDDLLVAVSALLHGNSLLGVPYSQVSTGPIKEVNSKCLSTLERRQDTNVQGA